MEIELQRQGRGISKEVQPTKPMHQDLMNLTTLLINIPTHMVFTLTLIWQDLISTLEVT